MTSQTASTQNSGSSGLSLAIRLREGSRDAWREMVDLYGPLVHGWCLRKGVSPPEAADVTQDVFLAVHRSIAAFDPARPGATFRGWLWTITLNKVRERARREEGPAAIGGSTAFAQLANLPDPGEREENEPSDSGATASLVRRALEQIRPTVEPKTWEAFWRTAVLGRPAPQVAEELALTSAAVRQAKSRVLRRLRRQLGERH
ncbi:MAG: sigma-70 family RNA polymerase sigma factor [Planctomycetes bacterium]|nr:sigma-70 family RNA polymerase sigma factor [Planctomycetota bacterium]